MAAENVTIRLVLICVAVAVPAFAMGGWLGDYNAKMSKTDAALASLANTVNGHENRIRALEGRVEIPASGR